MRFTGYGQVLFLLIFKLDTVSKEMVGVIYEKYEKRSALSFLRKGLSEL